MALSGDYNRKVTFKEPVVTQNSQGEESTAYENYLITWAKIKRNNQYRALEAGSAALINSDTVTIRKAANREIVGLDWLVNYEGRDHVIHSIDPETETTEIRFITKAKDVPAIES